MGLSRREFLNLMGCLMGGWVIVSPESYKLREMARFLVETSESRDLSNLFGTNHIEEKDTDLGNRITNSSNPPSSERGLNYWKRETSNYPETDQVLKEIGYFNKISPKYFVFDENKYSSPKRKLEPLEWKSTNRHLPIKIDPSVINKPGERSPQAIKRVVEYTQFHSPRYVAEPGERITMCNIAAWDWSRALQVHLPHWIGETEMSANMLFRWISHPQAGGIYGEGWQPVKPIAAQLLANRGIPVFALAENSVPGRHGHVSLVYPNISTLRENNNNVGPLFATVNNGHSRGGNGIKNLQNTFRWMKPTYFVHNNDFIVYRDA